MANLCFNLGMKNDPELGYVVPLVAAGTPFMLYGLFLLIPGSIIIEELAKLALVWWLVKTGSGKGKAGLAAISGMMFGISETVLYLLDISQLANLQPLVLRLLLTSPMHALTMLILYIGLSRGKTMGLVAFGIALAIHYCFNLIAVN